jgi:hypothetical protein
LLSLPIAFTSNHAAGCFKQAIRAKPADDFFGNTSWAFDLMAIFAVEKVLWWIEGKVGSR